MSYQPDQCPFCSAPVRVRCRCLLADSLCEIGHKWHRCPAHGRVVQGPSNHEWPMTYCSCPRKEAHEKAQSPDS